LCDAPPSTGYQIAGTKGAPIPAYVVKKFGLAMVDGLVTQGGELPRSPVSTQPRLVSDRELFVDADGVLYDAPQATGIKLVSAGVRIPMEYVRRYNLATVEGKIMQKSIPKVENKAVDGVPNKGKRGSGGLTIAGKHGERSSRGAS